MRRLLLVACTLTACDFARSSTSAGDAPIADARPDGAVPPDTSSLTCFQKWAAGNVQLGAPTKLAISSSGDDRDPFMSSDGLTLFFFSDRAGGGTDTFAAKRQSTTAAFTNAARRDDISSSGNESKFTMSGDQLTGIVASDRSGSSGGSFDLWIATRATAADMFTSFTNNGDVAALNDNTGQLDPHLSADGLRLYFAIGGPQRVVMATRLAAGAGFANVVDVIAGTTGNADPALTPDELVIVFTSNRPATAAGSNLWYATRASTSAPFGDAIELTALNSGSADGNAAFSHDGCELYFTSDRDGSQDLWVAPVL